MRRAPLGRLAALATCLVATGCASSLSRSVKLDEAGRGDGWVRVESMTELRQSNSRSCGAAALAMVLDHWGRPVTEKEVWSFRTPPADEGMRADALRDFAREQGLEAFLIPGELRDLEHEIGRDRPVLVGLMKPRGQRAFSHYEVVVAINPRSRRVVTLDPAEGARESSLKLFDAEWEAAGRVTLVVFPPATERSPVARDGPPSQ